MMSCMLDAKYLGSTAAQSSIVPSRLNMELFQNLDMYESEKTLTDPAMLQILKGPHMQVLFWVTLVSSLGLHCVSGLQWARRK